MPSLSPGLPSPPRRGLISVLSKQVIKCYKGLQPGLGPQPAPDLGRVSLHDGSTLFANSFAKEGSREDQMPG